MQREVAFTAADQPLREDVRLLGRIVGDVLVEQVGAAFFERVERVRHAAIERRETGSVATDALAAELAGLDLAGATELVRAFGTYFQVVNLAEQVHRIRRRREHERAGEGPPPGSLIAALLELKARGVTAAEVRAGLETLSLEPVFTAHPTEAVRRTMLDKERMIARALVERLDPLRTSSEEAARVGQIRMQVGAAWQTAEYSSLRPSVQDEREHVLYYLSDVLYRALPACYDALRRALLIAYPDADWSELPIVIRFASWVGGDMDGNPNVNAQTLRESLEVQQGLVLARYRAELRSIAPMLSQSTSRVGVDAAVVERLKTYRRRFPTAARAIPKRHREMPYRSLALLMAARLKATAQGNTRGYATPDAFLADLDMIAKSLAAHRGERAGLHLVRRLQWRARTFGFHLATLDVRQHAGVHRDVIGVLLGDAAWQSTPRDERVRRVAAALTAPPKASDDCTIDGRVAPTLEVFRVLAWARSRFGAAALGPYIVSMAESAEDVLGVLLLARVAGCVDASGHVPLDVSPLFETVDDLEAAPRVLDGLLRDPAYRAHLAARGGEQVVMLGYSDSSKDGGLVASRFALQRAQEQMVAIAQASATTLTFFHGRGGTVSRGGTKTERAIEAAPDGAIVGRLRLTEQGEVIHRKFGLRAVALRTIEQAASALLMRHLAPRRRDTREGLWARTMERIAHASRARYRELVYDDPQFNAYFRSATPIDIIERMPIGSRPSSRAGEQGIARLRAIPWVFAWSQCRCTLPGWYGLGSGLEAGIAELGLDGMREMAREWPFFETLLEDAEMVLAKSDLGIAARYSQLAGPLDVKFFPRIRAEFDRTIETVLAVRGTDKPLAFDPRLARSLRLRNPYVDPLSLLQISLLERWRAAGRREGALFRALVQTVTGIARGLQNTG